MTRRPEPDLFGAAPAGVGLSQAECEAVAMAGELSERLQVDYDDGTALSALAVHAPFGDA
ncbi:hypothetical protein TPA0908_40110 [Micromonospora sp. AKA38]|nr:hypothetical protein TPA0908_40110 [Micromonospora sp. AKA38]